MLAREADDAAIQAEEGVKVDSKTCRTFPGNTAYVVDELVVDLDVKVGRAGVAAARERPSPRTQENVGARGGAVRRDGDTLSDRPRRGKRDGGDRQQDEKPA